MEHILEYAAFGGSLCSAYLYGKAGYKGPIAGLITCLLFMAFGWYAGLYAAIFSNVIFFFIHGKNFMGVWNMDAGRKKKKIMELFDFVGKEIMPDRTKAKWWNNPLDGQNKEYFNQVPLKLALVHSEVTEALEAHRRSYINETGSIVWQPDDKLPHVNGLAKELGDTIIRCIEIAEALDLPLGEAIAITIDHNKSRPDHKIENMAKSGGKRY